MKGIFAPAVISGGRLTLYEPETFKQLISLLPDQRGVIKFESVKEIRSVSQNALFHVWLGIMASETGHDLDEMKSLMKLRFLKERILNEDGFMETRIRDTHSLNTKEFDEFLISIQQWAQQFLSVRLDWPDADVPLVFAENGYVVKNKRK